MHYAVFYCDCLFLVHDDYLFFFLPFQIPWHFLLRIPVPWLVDGDQNQSLHQSVLIVIVQWPKILRSANRRRSLDWRSRDSLSMIQHRLWNGQPPPGWPASPWLVVSWTIQGLKYGQIAVGKHLYGVLWLSSASQPRSSWRRDKQTCSFISHWPLSSCWHRKLTHSCVEIKQSIL